MKEISRGKSNIKDYKLLIKILDGVRQELKEIKKIFLYITILFSAVIIILTVSLIYMLIKFQ